MNNLLAGKKALIRRALCLPKGVETRIGGTGGGKSGSAVRNCELVLCKQSLPWQQIARKPWRTPESLPQTPSRLRLRLRSTFILIKHETVATKRKPPKNIRIFSLINTRKKSLFHPKKKIKIKKICITATCYRRPWSSSGFRPGFRPWTLNLHQQQVDGGAFY